MLTQSIFRRIGRKLVANAGKGYAITAGSGELTSMGDVIAMFLPQEGSQVSSELSDIWGVNEIISTDPRNALKLKGGLWFRGVSNYTYGLEPSIFRGGYDETSLFCHSSSLLSKHRRGYETAFSWLALMQHYGQPPRSRLLDWSESILSALFFATAPNPETDSEDGALWILNPSRLNHVSKFSCEPKGIARPHSLSVVMRSEMASTGTLDRLFRRKIVRDADELVSDYSFFEPLLPTFQTEEGKGLSNIQRENVETIKYILRLPIAVFPDRDNARLRAQHGTFTIHGGKQYPYTADSFRDFYDFEHEISLENINQTIIGENKSPEGDKLDELTKGLNGERILKRYRITPAGKKTIRKELSLFGVDEASQFVDLSSQLSLLEEQWSFRSS